MALQRRGVASEASMLFGNRGVRRGWHFVLLTLLCGYCGLSAAAVTSLDVVRFEAMTTQQRIAYLAEAYEAASKIPGPRPQGNSVFRDVIQPAYERIARYDGASVAAKLYGMTFGGVLEQPNSDWEQKAKAAAQSDSGFMTMFSAQRFAPLRLSGMELAGLQADVTRALARAAEQGDTASCQLMMTSTRNAWWTPKASQACLSAAYPSGTPRRWLDIPEGELRKQAMVEEAAKRGTARKPRDVSAAQDVARYCASVGVPSPSIDPVQARALAGRWDREGINYLLPYGPRESTLDKYVDDLGEVYARKLDARAIFSGSAVTPALTPLMFMALVKPQCGLQ